jgi:hypothetical protein
MVRVEQTPELDSNKTRVTIRQKYSGEGIVKYEARWREASGDGKTVSEALTELANDVEVKSE